MSFKKWMKLVDMLVWKMVGCSVYDLPDQLFLNWYEDGITPTEAAARVVQEALA